MSFDNETPVTEDPVQYTKKDFMSDQVIRWCPGCGDYSILSQVQTVMADIGLVPDQVAIVSGIGCSSRFPYYMNTYGFHTIHGRAPAVATGVKCTNPELSVWVITGDGDGLSIGGNQTAHMIRRNLDVQILLFNNRIYGLTKGQYSPTSEVGKKTKSTPLGSLDHPFQPLHFILGCGGTFIARSVDIFPTELRETLKAAAQHKGSSFVEIYQNCNIFNDGAFDAITEKAMRDERCLFLKHGEPMVFGAKDSRKGIRLNGLKLEIVQLGAEFSEKDLLVHDKHNPLLASMLVQLDFPEWPVPMGVIYEGERSTYDEDFRAQVAAAKAKLGEGDLHKLIFGKETWKVE